MMYTYRNFIDTFLLMSAWWDIHTATLYQLFCRLTLGEIDIPQLYINFPADEHVMIYTYGSFIWTFLRVNTWWYIHTATLYQLSFTRTRNDIYILQRFINFPADKNVLIYSCCNFTSIFFDEHINIFAAALYQLSCRWRSDNIYIVQLDINFPYILKLFV